jgi:hypothetical protein
VCGAHLVAGFFVVAIRELSAGIFEPGREATVKVYGVAVAMPQGYSRVPHSSTEQ